MPGDATECEWTGNYGHTVAVGLVGTRKWRNQMPAIQGQGRPVNLQNVGYINWEGAVLSLSVTVTVVKHV